MISARPASAGELIDQVRVELTAVLGIDSVKFVAGGKRSDAPVLLTAAARIARPDLEQRLVAVALSSHQPLQS